MIPKRSILNTVIMSILGVVAAVLAASQAQAQDDAAFFMLRPQTGVALSARVEEEQRRSGDSKTTTTENEFRESVTFDTRGWVYHPNLLDFHLSFTPQWQQETFREVDSLLPEDRSESENASILAFDADTTLLKNRPLSINIFANRNREQIDFSDFRDSDLDSEAWGSRLSYVNSVLPVSLSYAHRRLDRSGFYRSSEERDETQAVVQHLASKSVTRLNLFHTSTNQTTREPFGEIDASLKSTSTDLTNAYFFTADNAVRLDSRLYNLQAEYNELDHTTWLLSEKLFWPQTKQLLTRFDTSYSHRKYGDAVSAETRFGAGLTHQYRDRLTTAFDTAAIMSTFGDGGENLYQANLDLRYRRPIPWGSIELGTAYYYGVAYRKGGLNIIPMDLQLTLNTGTDTFLSRDNVILASIVVTDLSGSIVYTPNIDYLIDTVGSEIRISRTLTGAIADGQQVMVRFSYSLDAGFDDSRFGQTYEVHLDLWSFLFLTYTHDRLNQTIESGEAPYEPLDDVTNTIRLSVVWKWSETRLVYQKQDRSNANSTDTRSIDQQLNFRLAQNLLLNFSGRFGQRDYTDTDIDEQFYTLGTSIAWTPAWWCRISLNALRNIVTCNGQDNLDSQVAGVVILNYGLWTGSATYRLRDQDDQRMDNHLWRQEVLFTVSRRLW